MAKITRVHQRVFGSNAGAQGITEYGSPATGTPTYTTNVGDAQSLQAWLDGWSAAALAGSEIPTFQDFNAIHYVTTSQLAYLFQEGIPEYDASTEYHQNSIVKKAGTYELYGSKINTNAGNALPSQADNTQWQYLGDLAELVNAGSVADATTTTKGIIEIATDAEAFTGTATDKAIVPSNFTATQSMAATGYQRLPGGLILQWGETAVFTSTITVTFPIAFPTACFQGYGATMGGTAGGTTSPSVQSITPTSMTIGSGTGVTAVTMRWLAIGH